MKSATMLGLRKEEDVFVVERPYVNPLHAEISRYPIADAASPVTSWTA
jgi:hypothetical protein